MTLLRVPNKLLRNLGKAKGLVYVVQITAFEVGEMKNPASILVDETKLDSTVVKELKFLGCKNIKS